MRMHLSKEATEYFESYKKLIVNSAISVDEALINDDEILAFKLNSNNRIIKYRPGLPWRLRNDNKIFIGWSDSDATEKIKNYFKQNDIYVDEIKHNKYLDLLFLLSNGMIFDTYVTATEYISCWSFKDMSDELYEFVVTGEGVILIEDGEAYEI